MINQKNIAELLRKDLPNLRRVYNVKRIGFFGSFAKGTQGKKSDIDIFVEFQKPLGLNFVDFAEHVENVLGRKVDAITNEGVNAIRVKDIANSIKKGIVYV